MRKLLLTAFAILASYATASAQDIPPSPIVKTALVIDASAIKKDNVLWAGVQFTLPEHWHIYWQNPGDSGIPTTLSITAPEGIKAGEIVWPTPEPLETSGLVNYGYSNQVTLPVPLMVERDDVRGTLTINAKWLVCRDVCVPESAVLSATLPTSTANAAKLLEDAMMHAPQPLMPVEANYRIAGDQVTLNITSATLFPANAAPVTNAIFFPLDDGILANAEPQHFSSTGNTLTLTLKRGSADPVKAWHGVVQVTRGAAVQNYTLMAYFKGAEPTATLAAPTPAPVAAAPVSLVAALVLAFVGGLILNIMPCVLPILALKALAITKKAQSSRTAAAKQGLSYTVGVLVSFLVIAGIMLALKASGAAIGWGFQLQNAGFVSVLAVIMLLVAANLLGWFQLPVLFGAKATGVNEEKFSGSFLTGVLAVLVATPCTAPFMATAVGATLTFSTLPALLVFVMIGFGMASPFLLISLWPAVRRILPKPGAWMHRFKQILALPMLATAAWLIWVLVQLTGHATVAMEANHVAYSPAALQQLREEGKPVLVDATAAWCLSCKVNERVALRPEAMQQFFREQQVTLMVADWTASDPSITAYLAGFGRNGVPLYVYYPPHGTPVVLPQILTPALVRDTIAPHHE